MVRLSFSSLIFLLVASFAFTANAAEPTPCGADPRNPDPCTWVHTSPVPKITAFPVNQLICFDYKKLSGSKGKVGLFALETFDPNDLQNVQAQLDRAVFKDHRDGTGTSGVWCRGRHWFKDSTVVVFCDEDGGIGWVSGDSLTYAKKNTWLPNRRPVVMGAGNARIATR